MVVCSVMIPCSILQLPPVEADMQTILSQNIQKLKWQTNSPSDHPSCCASSSSPGSVFSMSPCRRTRSCVS
jgi:hypothetical protein